MDCLFCKIINDEIPSYTIYEDEIVKVFLDINPDANGHTLIVPKKHIVNINDIDEETLLHIHKITKEIYAKMKANLGVIGLTLNQNNGHGQIIKHYHLHLIPRYEDDNYHSCHNEDSIKNIDEVYVKLKG